MEILKEVHKKEINTFKLQKETIIKLFQNLGYRVPDSARIQIHIPGGGDWSNQDIYLGEEVKTIDVIWIIDTHE